MYNEAKKAEIKHKISKSEEETERRLFVPEKLRVRD